MVRSEYFWYLGAGFLIGLFAMTRFSFLRPATYGLSSSTISMYQQPPVYTDARRYPRTYVEPGYNVEVGPYIGEHPS